MSFRIRSTLVATAALLVGGVIAAPAIPAGAAGSRAPVTTRVISGGETTRLRPTAGAGETAPAVGPEAGSTNVPVANRSLSSRAKATRPPIPLSGIVAADTPITAGSTALSFSGINHHQQRLEIAGGNQWSLEPPDQALCIGGGFVFEAVNNAVAVYDMDGNQQAIDSLNHFFNYPFEIDRTAGAAGPKQTTDPTCLYDPATGSFFLTILTYDADAAGNPLPSGHNTLDTAVSAPNDPLGTWTITHIDATDDGSGDTPSHPGCPCIGDYPHIGVDANGYYITTNEYPFFTDGFVGAQIYAMSKVALSSGATAVTVAQFDTSRAAPGDHPGFTVWPAQSPAATDYDTRANGTEYFLSTNAAEEAQGANGTERSSDLLTWSLTNTAAVATNPGALVLRVVNSTVGTYAVPIAAEQKVGPVPLADCLNVTWCAKTVSGTPDKFKETERPLDSLDSRMQQVTYAAGKLYGSHGTAVDVGSSAFALAQRTGVAWYVTQPVTAANGNLSTAVLQQGRIASAGNNLLMPSLGVRADGSVAIGVTLAGVNHFPSAAYIDISAAGAVGSVKVIAEGVGPEDGFAGYRLFGARPRWGDYGAAALDPDGHLWVANEWIGQSCTFAQYTATPFGQCGGTRTSLANWSTRITRID